MSAPDDLREQLLRGICARAEGQPGEEIDARPLAAELGIELRHLFSGIVALVDMECLEYVRAGPVVKLTALGARQCDRGDRPEEVRVTAP